MRARFENTGPISRDSCRGDSAWSGPAARACGIVRDVRHDFPSGIYRFAQIPVIDLAHGDVFARAYVRWLEIQRSLRVHPRPAGRPARRADCASAAGALAPNTVAVALVEGWRGEICHVALTDATGRFLRVQDHRSARSTTGSGWPWPLRDQQISDFPLCNKSFNLSYCGHDL